MTALAEEFAAILDGSADEAAITAFLVRSIDMMGDPAAIATGAQALRDRMIRVRAPAGAIDVCGTGGDGAHTLNVSTAVAFVLAGAGVPVAKHGNRAMSSQTGAADVLEALGVKLTADVAVLEACLEKAKVAFLFAQNHHPAMRFVAGPRRALGRRTIFNLLGPLSNPAGVTRQLVGVFDYAFAAPMAAALQKLGAARAIVVHGHGGLDELSSEGENLAFQLDAGVRSDHIVSAADAGLQTYPNAAIKGGDAAFNAAALRALLDGQSANPVYEAIVTLNAAAAFQAAGRADTLREGAALAQESLKSGQAKHALSQLVTLSQRGA